LRYCTNCLMPETRPRISYDEHGVCNACLWAKEKSEVIDWDSRGRELEALCEENRQRNPSQFDCLVPASGGKDSSYVAYMMKHKMKMHPLSVTIAPPLSYALGDRNLENFIYSGFDNVRITPNPEVGSQIARTAFIEQGQPLMAWIMSVQTTIFRCAVLFNLPFVMFGEEGEVEYGGSTKLKHKACYELEDSIKIYLSGNDPKRFLGQFSEKELYWWQYPSEEEFRAIDPKIAHWSYFENWDSYEHYLLAKEKCGLGEEEARCLGTYNNFAQTDTKLYDLHCYLMYLKFGFGRCSQDVGIDIRRGAMTRKQGLALAKRYDGEYPKPYIQDYLNYFKMTQEEFDDALDRHANRDLFKKVDGQWLPTFMPH
jgi:N-acetyl sugar amidotransferase